MELNLHTKISKHPLLINIGLSHLNCNVMFSFFGNCTFPYCLDMNMFVVMFENSIHVILWISIFFTIHFAKLIKLYQNYKIYSGSKIPPRYN